MLIYSQPLEVTQILDTVDQFLRTHLSPGMVSLSKAILTGLLLLVAYAVIALALIYIERKVAAFFQARLGPNRLGKYGIFQSLADMIKILIKEIIPIHKADQLLFFAASFFVIIASLMAFGAIPFGMDLHAIDFNIASFTCWPSRRWASSVYCWRDGRATTNIP